MTSDNVFSLLHMLELPFLLVLFGVTIAPQSDCCLVGHQWLYYMFDIFPRANLIPPHVNCTMDSLWMMKILFASKCQIIVIVK